MLTRACTVLPHPPDAVTALLIAPGHQWSVALEEGGSALLAKVGLNVAGVPVYKKVKLQIGQSTTNVTSRGIMLPVSWKAVGGPPIFPQMEGTLHVEPAPGGTTLWLNARYDPPFGQLGVLIDRAVMHRMAEITMTDFVQRLAAALTSELEKARPGPQG